MSLSRNKHTYAQHHPWAWFNNMHRLTPVTKCGCHLTVNPSLRCPRCGRLLFRWTRVPLRTLKALSNTALLPEGTDNIQPDSFYADQEILFLFERVTSMNGWGGGVSKFNRFRNTIRSGSYSLGKENLSYESQGWKKSHRIRRNIREGFMVICYAGSSQNISGKENSCISCHGELDWSQVANQSYLDIL